MAPFHPLRDETRVLAARALAVLAVLCTICFVLLLGSQPGQTASAEAKDKEMEDQRMAATKERLVKREGIQDKRLIAGEPNKPPSDAKEGMVEFTVGGIDE